MKKTIFLLISILFCVFALSAAAQSEQPLPTNTADTNKQEVVRPPAPQSKITVYAEKPQNKAVNPPGQVTVITADEISLSGARTLGDIVEPSVGVVVNRYGGVGQMQVLSVRGSSPEQVLVLVDGQRMNTAQGGAVDISSINPESIERVEIIRGGAGSRYGANAFGGVVNIITKGVIRQKKEIRIGYGMGSYTMHRGSFLCRTPIGSSTDIFISGSGLTSAGVFQFAEPKTSRTILRTNAHINSGQITVKAGHLLKGPQQRRIGISADYYADDKGVPGMYEFPTVHAHMSDERTCVQAAYSSRFGAARQHAIQANMFFTHHLRRFRDPEYYLGGINSRHDNISTGGNISGMLQYTFGNTIHHIKPGCSIQRDILESSAYEKSPGILNNSSIPQETMKSIYINDEIHCFPFETDSTVSNIPGKIVITPAVRYDMHSLYDDTPTGSIRAAVHFDRQQRTVLKTGYGTSYRVPGFDDLFWPSTAFAVGNPDLKPEQSEDYDIGLLVKPYHWMSWESIYFHKNVKNLIRWVSGALGQWRPSNIDNVIIQGAELESKLFWELAALKSALSLQMNYTLLFATDNSGNPNTDGKQLMYRPHETAHIIATLRSIRDHYIRYHIRYVGARYYTAQNTAFISDYISQDITCGIQVWRRGKLQGIVRNIFDTQYVDVRGYPVPGREFEIRMAVDVF